MIKKENLISADQNRQPASSNQKTRDLNVELLRLFACLMVIAVHIKPLNVQDGVLLDAGVLFQTVCAPAVGIFFLISGFFLPKTRSIKKAWLRFLRDIALPALLVLAASCMLRGWLHNEAGFLESLRSFRPSEEFPLMLRGILAFDPALTDSYSEHLWFVFSYALLMLWLPFIRAIIKKENAGEKALLLFCGIYGFSMFLADAEQLHALPFPIYRPFVPPAELLYFMLGWLLYRRVEGERKVWQATREQTPAKQSKELLQAVLPRLVLLLLLFVPMFLLQRRLYVELLSSGADPNLCNLSYHYLSWKSLFGVLTALLCTGLLLRLSLPSAPLLQSLIPRLSSFTWPVYLLHFPLVQKLRGAGFEPWLKHLLHADTVPGVLLYMCLYTIGLFLFCAGLSFGIRSAKFYIHGLLFRHKA